MCDGSVSHSVPVLVSPHVNLATEIVSAKAGWIAAVDKDALAARLAEALRDEEELARRGRAGKQLSQKYSWDNAARGLVQLYSGILKSSECNLECSFGKHKLKLTLN